MRRLIISEVKKRYMSLFKLREGNLLNPPKTDIKGFEIKVPCRVIYIENNTNCWELSLGH